jgi:hypothetical protein
LAKPKIKKVHVPECGVFNVPPGIVRIDAKKVDRPSQWHGWQVRIKSGSKFFSDSRFGGPKGALNAAKKYLHVSTSDAT